MKSRGRATPAAEFLIVVVVLLPISACSWANPWQSGSWSMNPWRSSAAEAAEGEAEEESAEGEKKEIPQVKLSRDEQRIYNRYYTPPGRALGVSEESRSIEERLGVN